MKKPANIDSSELRYSGEKRNQAEAGGTQGQGTFYMQGVKWERDWVGKL